MTDKRLLGAFGEQRAALFLRENGYRILSANFRCECGEIDVIAEKDGIICFVEVKTRTEGAMLPPSSAVGIHKMKNITSAADVYMGKYGLKNDVRFDIVEVITDKNGALLSVNHIKNAF